MADASHTRADAAPTRRKGLSRRKSTQTTRLGAATTARRNTARTPSPQKSPRRALQTVDANADASPGGVSPRKTQEDVAATTKVFTLGSGVGGLALSPSRRPQSRCEGISVFVDDESEDGDSDKENAGIAARRSSVRGKKAAEDEIERRVFAVIPRNDPRRCLEASSELPPPQRKRPATGTAQDNSDDDARAAALARMAAALDEVEDEEAAIAKSAYATPPRPRVRRWRGDDYVHPLLEARAVARWPLSASGKLQGVFAFERAELDGVRRQLGFAVQEDAYA
ncbi:uncharacterized protein V1518DRAFT_413975 [Limtongia smithiae]|uniref:uncharacterized protein n=1 Tax=Limtongia smithiae TaxID=1125753 RepID=UPI0034D01802